MERNYIESSMIRSVGYDANSSTLEIEFNTGPVWQYYSVPENVYYELISGSAGKYFLNNIKNRYTGSKVG